MSIKISSTSSNNSSGELHTNEHYFTSLVSNLNLSSVVASSNKRRTGSGGENDSVSPTTAITTTTGGGAQSTTNLNNAQSNQIITQAQAREVEPFLYNKSKFKTIKIFVASNKNEFSNELECLHREVLPELQQYFMQYGYDFSFVDFNLNLDIDPFLDPNLFDCMLNELDDCYRVSDGCFFLALLGNKHGITPLPSELNSNQIETIRSLSSSQDFEFFKSWYVLDDMTKLYKLKPFVSSFKNIYNIQTDNIESRKVEMRALKDTYDRLYDTIQQLANSEQKNVSSVSNKNSGSGSASGSLNSTRSKKIANHGVADRVGLSGLELLTQTALRYSSNECFIFSRILENIDVSKKSAGKYVDLSNNRIDKQKEEKQAKFRDGASIQKQLGEENRIEVKLKWKESFGDEVSSKNSERSGDHFGDTGITIIRKSSSPPATLKQAATTGASTIELQQQQLVVTTQPEVSVTTEAVNEAELTNGVTHNSNTNNPIKFFDKFEPEYKSYLEHFISMLVEKLKHLINKSVRAFDAACDCRFNWHEIALLQEITRHMHRFEKTSAFFLSPLDSDEYIDRFKRLVQTGSRTDHWPVFIYGLPCTGKSFLLNRFATIALTLYPNSYSLIRYFELTGQCSTFEGLLFSLCEQLSMLDHSKTPTTMTTTTSGTGAAVLAPQDQPQSLPQQQTQQATIYHQLRSKDITQLVEYFYKQCKLLSEKQPIFVFVEGLHDMNAERSMLSKTSVSNNQIAWLFANKLPPNVHIIATIKRQSMASVRTGFEAMNNELGVPGSNITKRPSTTSTTPSPLGTTYIPLFLYYLNENVINESSALPTSTPAMLTVNNSNPNMSAASSTSSNSSSSSENCIFEMPVQIKKLDVNELGALLRQQLITTSASIDSSAIASELGVLTTPLCDEYLKGILQGLLHQNNGNPASNSSSSSSPSPLTTVQIDTSSVVGGSAATILNATNNTNYYYVNFFIRDLIMSGRFILPSIIAANDSFPRDLDAYFRIRIDAIEKKFNTKMLSILFNYISASHNGVTEMELIDLLSCNNELFTEFYTDSNLPSILKFSITYWIMLKFQLGYFLSRKYVDCKITYHWTNDTIKKLMKQRYLNKVDQIRQCHKDMANYFLESFIETKPLVDMSRNLHLRDEDGRRYIAQQPLVYSETKYNYRRMSELWFHLMNSGDIQRLKEHAFFNYEHLLAKCHGMSVQVLLNDIDTVLRRILDVDILLMCSLLRKSMLALVQDPLRLASEILARMRPLEEEYGEHVTSLVNQVLTWCDQHDAPVLVPYTTWLDTPESLLVTKIEHAEGILKLAVTSFNQHVFFSNSKNEICMYHIPSKKMVRRFSGHSDTINFLLISHNNRYLISGSSDKLIKVWNLGNGEMENTFNNHKSAILCGILTYSDEFLITGTYDRLINVIRVETGDIVLSEEKHFDSVTALAISLDDTILVSASLDKSIKRWSFPEMELVDTISTIYSPIKNMNLTNDNTFLIIGCENHSVQVKSLITGSDIHEIASQSGPGVNAMVTSADCERIFLGCSDSKLYLYDIKTRDLIAVLVEQEAPINDLRLSADSSFLFSSSGNSLYVLNMKKKKFNSSKTATTSTSTTTKSSAQDLQNLPTRLVKAIAMSKDGEMAITGDNYGQVSLWNLVRGELIETIIEDSLSSPPVDQQTQQNNLTISTGAGATINTVDQQNGSVGPQIAQQPQKAHHYHLSSTNTLIAVNHVALFNSHLFSLIAFSDSTVSVYDNEIGDVVAVFDEHQTPVKYLHILEESRRVFTSDGINSCKIWVPHSGQLLETITVACSLIGLSPDSKYVVSGPGDNNAKIWLLSDAQVIRNINHKDRISTLSFTPDSVYVITGSEDCSCKIWELATGKLIQVLIEHEAAITSIAAPVNNSMVISGGRDKLVLVWNFKDGSVLHKLVAHTDVIVRVAITHDASTVVSGSRDGLVCVWSAHHGNLLSSLFLQHPLADLVVAYDASHIVARLDDSDIMPIIGLTRKWPKELAIARTMSSSSLRSFEHFNKGIVKRLNRYQMILPIKPKPLMIKNKSTHFSTFFTEDSKLKELIRIRKESEPNALTIGQNENSISTPQHSFSRNNAAGGGSLTTGDKLKSKRKVKKPGAEANSTSSGMAANRGGKQRKTKICCLL